MINMIELPHIYSWCPYVPAHTKSHLYPIDKKSETKHLDTIINPRNDLESILHRKLKELHDTKMEVNHLEVKLQKEKTHRMKVEEKLAKQILAHRAEKQELINKTEDEVR